MRYAISLYKLYQEEVAYRVYVADSLYYQAENKQLTKRYMDIIRPKPVDTRTGDEIALDVITRLGLKVDNE